MAHFEGLGCPLTWKNWNKQHIWVRGWHWVARIWRGRTAHQRSCWGSSQKKETKKIHSRPNRGKGMNQTPGETPTGHRTQIVVEHLCMRSQAAFTDHRFPPLLHFCGRPLWPGGRPRLEHQPVLSAPEMDFRFQLPFSLHVHGSPCLEKKRNLCCQIFVEMANLFFVFSPHSLVLHHASFKKFGQNGVLRFVLWVPKSCNKIPYLRKQTLKGSDKRPT